MYTAPIVVVATLTFCRTPCHIADRQGTIFTTLAGAPNDAEWPALVSRVSDKFADAQRQMAELADEPEHRRGKYFAGHCGHSIGSGQQVRTILSTRLRWTDM